MASAKEEAVFIISYLLVESENDVVGYSDLATRLHILQKEFEQDERISGRFVDAIRKLVNQDDNGLDWQGLKLLLDNNHSTRLTNMLISIEVEEIEEGKWKYKFCDNAPKTVVVERLDDLSDENKRLLEKIKKVAKMDVDEVFAEAYST